MMRDKLIEIRAAGHLAPRDRIWMAIRAAHQDTGAKRMWTLGMIQHASKTAENTVRLYLQGLVAAGYVRRLTEDGVYQLERDVGAIAPRVPTKGSTKVFGAVQQALWTAMRVLRTWGPHELASAASTEDLQVPVGNAQRYSYLLSRSGFLHLHGGRFSLIPTRNTGPRSPVVSLATRTVLDANTGIAYPMSRRKGNG